MRLDPVGAGRAATAHGAPMAWSVSALLLALSDQLAARFPAVAVRGELSGFVRAGSGHCYFSLKDHTGAPALLRCAMFRRAAAMVTAPLRDGLQVEVRGRLAVFEARGELQMVVESLRPVGAGNLYEEFLRLKERLTAEGLFTPERRLPLPPYPQRVGLVTSPDAAALRDVLTTLRRRAPHVAVRLYPCRVQGQGAPESILQALQWAQSRAECDVLLLVRGGGSLEDLWSFNDERVVRAVDACRIPLVCGVGHETDLTLCDLAADLRAPTPTAAAEMAVPTTEALQAALGDAEARVLRVLTHRLQQAQQRLDALSLRARAPGLELAQRARRLDALSARRDGLLGQRIGQARARVEPLQGRAAAALHLGLQRAAHQVAPWAGRSQRALALALERARAQLDGWAGRLERAHPKQVLQRGFAWIENEAGQPVTAQAQLAVGQALALHLADGTAGVRVETLLPAPSALPTASKSRGRARKSAP